MTNHKNFIASIFRGLDEQILFAGLLLTLAMVAVLAIIVVLLLVRTTRLSRILATLVTDEKRPVILAQSRWWPRLRSRTYVPLIFLVAAVACAAVIERNRLAVQHEVHMFLTARGLPSSLTYDWGMLGDTQLARVIRHLSDDHLGRSMIDVALPSRSLNLSAAPVTDADIAKLCRVRSLEGVYLCVGHYTAQGLAPLAKLPRLRRLAISGVTLDDTLLALLAECESLESIALLGCHVSSSRLSELAKLPQLEEVYFEGEYVDGDFLKAMAQQASIQFYYYDQYRVIEGATIPPNVHEQASPIPPLERFRQHAAPRSIQELSGNPFDNLIEFF